MFARGGGRYGRRGFAIGVPLAARKLAPGRLMRTSALGGGHFGGVVRAGLTIRRGNIDLNRAQDSVPQGPSKEVMRKILHDNAAKLLKL